MNKKKKYFYVIEFRSGLYLKTLEPPDSCRNTFYALKYSTLRDVNEVINTNIWIISHGGRAVKRSNI